jgi:hypothetical protein
MSSAAAPAPSWHVALLVRHPTLGLGKIVHVSGNAVRIYFRDFPEKQPGDALKLIDLRHCQLKVAEVQSDPWLDNIPPLVDGKMFLSKPRLTVEQQISLFKNRYPHGFKDPSYLKQRDRYWNAHLAYVEQIGNGLGLKTLKQDSLAKLGGQVRRVLGKSKYLNKYEALAFHDAIGDNNAAVAHKFFECLFTLVEEPQLIKANLDPYFAAVCELPWSGPKLSATWPVSTILPYLADPSRFVLLQPEVTKQAAERYPFNLMYDPEPNSRTYEQLLILCDNLLAVLTPLGARDYMDVQAFIWAVGVHR